MLGWVAAASLAGDGSGLRRGRSSLVEASSIVVGSSGGGFEFDLGFKSSSSDSIAGLIWIVIHYWIAIDELCEEKKDVRSDWDGKVSVVA